LPPLPEPGETTARSGTGFGPNRPPEGPFATLARAVILARMIEEVDTSLAAFLTTLVDGRVSVRFDAPDPEWRTKSKEPIVAAFLYDIRDRPEGRTADWTDVRDQAGRVVERQSGPRPYRLSYLLTVWGASVAEEHRVLGAILRGGIDYEQLPESCLTDALRASPPITLQIGQADAPVAPPAWSELGVPVRASLTLSLTVPLQPTPEVGIGPPVEHLHLEAQRLSGAESRRPAASGEPAVDQRERKWASFRVREGIAPEGPSPR
jgi:hypothetical protein